MSLCIEVSWPLSLSLRLLSLSAQLALGLPLWKDVRLEVEVVWVQDVAHEPVEALVEMVRPHAAQDAELAEPLDGLFPPENEGSLYSGASPE